MADPEAGDGHVVGRLIGGQDAEGDVLVAAPLELPGGAHAKAVAVQQHAEQELGIVGGVAVPVVAVGSVEGGKVELVDHVEDEPGEVAGGQPIAQVGGAGRAGRGRRAGSCSPWRILSVRTVHTKRQLFLGVNSVLPSATRAPGRQLAAGHGCPVDQTWSTGQGSHSTEGTTGLLRFPAL